jgi:hypothetical protein
VQGALGLASGKDATKFDRVWFKEVVDPTDVIFDYDTYVLLPTKARALKEVPSVEPTEPITAGRGARDAKLVGSAAENALLLASEERENLAVRWQGEVKRDQWNLFSLKLLTRLARSDDVKLKVAVEALIKDAKTLEELNSALRELGLEGTFDV